MGRDPLTQCQKFVIVMCELTIMFIFVWRGMDVAAPKGIMVVELFYFGVYRLPPCVCDFCKGSFTLSEESDCANAILQFNRRGCADTDIKIFIHLYALFSYRVALYKSVLGNTYTSIFHIRQRFLSLSQSVCMNHNGVEKVNSHLQ